MTKETDALAPCPFCGTEMHRHEKCFSHPRPASGDCILRHYSFDDADGWNRRAYADTIERQAAEIDRLREDLTVAGEAMGDAFRDPESLINSHAAIQKFGDALMRIQTKEASHDR